MYYQVVLAISCALHDDDARPNDLIVELLWLLVCLAYRALSPPPTTASWVYRVAEWPLLRLDIMLQRHWPVLVDSMHQINLRQRDLQNCKSSVILGHREYHKEITN